MLPYQTFSGRYHRSLRKRLTAYHLFSDFFLFLPQQPYTDLQQMIIERVCTYYIYSVTLVARLVFFAPIFCFMMLQMNANNRLHFASFFTISGNKLPLFYDIFRSNRFFFFHLTFEQRCQDHNFILGYSMGVQCLSQISIKPTITAKHLGKIRIQLVHPFCLSTKRMSNIK